MNPLSQHYTSIAKQFLQTAIVIDDQAAFGPAVTVVPSGSISAPPRGLLDAGEDAPPAVGVTLELPTEVPAASLDAKILSDAFISLKMICGLYRPSAGDNMVAHTVQAAETADIVVVDWHLEHGRSRLAKDIILGILRGDNAQSGRLRLIAVYTSQPGRAKIASELFQEIEQDDTLKGRLTLNESVIWSTDTRIIILNKRNTLIQDDCDPVPEADLPERLVKEFAELSAGIMPSFALASVAAVRRGAHHVLALYTDEIDGAFVGHRCGIPHPEDAKGFAVDLISAELRNLIEVDDVAEQTLNRDVISKWIQAQVDAGHRFQSDRAEIPREQVEVFLAQGARAVEKSRSVQHVHDDLKTKVGEKHVITCGSLPRAFYKMSADAQLGVRRLSRLSTFQREAGILRAPSQWSPLLTLGCLVQRLEEGHGKEIMLCVQPRCDSVRLKDVTAFPFQTVSLEQDHFNIVLRDLAGEEREAWVNLKPRDAVMLPFAPDPDHKCVRGAFDQDSQRYIFRPVGDAVFVWLGDIKEMKAQLWAGQLGARVQGVGLEEFEWLRWASERKLKAKWT